MDRFTMVSIFVAALVPLIMGFIWYNPKFLGNAWMKEAGLNEDSMKGFNMAKTFILTYILSVLICTALMPMVIHQMGVFSMVMNEPGMKDPNSEISMWLNGIMDKYGNNFRTFKHGALHGTLAGIFLGLPIMGINAMFERKSWKYVFINAGFWAVCLALMGGIICAWK